MLHDAEWGPYGVAPSWVLGLLDDVESGWAWVGDCGWHAIAVDLRGHGQSQLDLDTCDRSISAMDADLIETVAAVRSDVRGVDWLVGHSLAAWTRRARVCVVEGGRFRVDVSTRVEVFGGGY